jgi:hypothetical protein
MRSSLPRPILGAYLNAPWRPLDDSLSAAQGLGLVATSLASAA